MGGRRRRSWLEWFIACGDNGTMRVSLVFLSSGSLPRIRALGLSMELFQHHRVDAVRNSLRYFHIKANEMRVNFTKGRIFFPTM